MVSDIGHVTALVKDRLQSVNTLFVESNYDEEMLQKDTKRPWPTKQRISSRHGHLSNSQTADLVVSIAARSRRLHRVVLGHLSCDCNAPHVALQSIRNALGSAGFAEIEVDCADQKPRCPCARRHSPPIFIPFRNPPEKGAREMAKKRVLSKRISESEKPLSRQA